MKKVRFFFTLTCLVGSVCTTSAQSEEISKVKIVNAWSKYFKSLRSVQFSWKYTITTHPVKEAVGQTWSNKFSLNGTKFRYEATLPNTVKDTDFSATAYDGQRYQILDAGISGARLIYRKEPSSETPYGGEIPLVMLYDFAFSGNAFHTLETLQQRETWQKVLRRTVSVNKSTFNGRQGLWVKIKGNANSENYEVLLDEVSLLPIYFQRTAQILRGPKNVVQVNSIEVAKTTTWVRGGRKIEFPVRIEGQLKRNGVPYIADVNEIDSQSLKINKPIHRSVFVIPESQAVLVLDQTNVKDFGKSTVNTTKSK